MAQLFPVPDENTEGRMRRALDILEVARRIENRLGKADSRLSEVRRQASEDEAEAAIDLLCRIAKDGKFHDDETAVELMQLMTLHHIQNPIDKISQVFEE